MEVVDERHLHSDGMEMLKHGVFDKISCREDDAECMAIVEKVRELDERRDRTIQQIKKCKAEGDFEQMKGGYVLLAKIADEKETALKRGSELAFKPRPITREV